MLTTENLQHVLTARRNALFRNKNEQTWRERAVMQGSGVNDVTFHSMYRTRKLDKQKYLFQPV